MSVRRIVSHIAENTGLRSPLLRLCSSEFRCNHRLVKSLSREITEAGFEKICRRREQYIEATRKYLELDRYLEEVVREARALGLLDSSGLRVLDMGCGAGYFLYTLRKYGHDILGLDIDNYIFYNEIVELLKIPRITHQIEKFKPLPDLGEPFDLITAFSICFDCHGTEHVWGVSEWEYFIDDCLGHLRPDGRLFFCFNPASTHVFDFVPDEVEEMLRKIPGAHLSHNKEKFLLDYAKHAIV